MEKESTEIMDNSYQKNEEVSRWKAQINQKSTGNLKWYISSLAEVGVPPSIDNGARKHWKASAEVKILHSEVKLPM